MKHLNKTHKFKVKIVHFVYFIGLEKVGGTKCICFQFGAA